MPFPARRFAALLLLFSLAASAAPAEPRRVTLSVPGMFCAACPLIVRHALSSVPGVESVTVDLRARTATVSYDDAAAGPEHLLAASRNAGYPAEVRAR